MRKGDTLAANISPTMVEYMQKILNIQQELVILRRRFQVADAKDIDNEGDFQWFHRVLQENNLEPWGDQALSRQLERLEEVYRYSDSVKKRLASQIDVQEDRLLFIREFLEQELRKLLAPLDMLQVPDSASKTSEHDFAEAEDNEQVEDREVVSGVRTDESKDPENQAREDAAVTWKQAKNQLRIAQLRFDQYEEFYDNDLADYMNAVAEGQCDVSRTMFDLTHINELRELTRDLIEAERKHNEVAFRAVQLGVMETAASQSSWFVNQEGDDEEQVEEVFISSARTNITRIEKWQEDLPKGAALDAVEERGEISREWDARSIRFGDGISAYADGRERVKIDRWEELRMADRKVMKEEDFLRPEAATGDAHSGLTKLHKVSVRSRASLCT